MIPFLLTAAFKSFFCRDFSLLKPWTKNSHLECTGGRGCLPFEPRDFIKKFQYLCAFSVFINKKALSWYQIIILKTNIALLYTMVLSGVNFFEMMPS